MDFLTEFLSDRLNEDLSRYIMELLLKREENWLEVEDKSFSFQRFPCFQAAVCFSELHRWYTCYRLDILTFSKRCAPEVG